MNDWLIRGKSAQSQGRLDEAIYFFEQAARQEPRDREGHNHLAGALIQAVRLEDAARSLQEALNWDPGNVDAANSLGIVFARLGQSPAAIVCFQHAITLQPTNAALHSNLGNVLSAVGRNQEAAASHRESLRLNPHSPDTHNNLGSVFLELEDYEQARHCFQEAMRLKPDFAEAHNNLGSAYCRCGQLEQATACYQQALVLRPTYAEALSNLGGIRGQQGRYDEAMAYYDQALRCDPALADAHLNRALGLLVQGRWPEGWVEYEWRWRTKGFPRLAFKETRWDGRPLPGRTLLVVAEQGLGDTLQFVRYLATARQRVGQLFLKCDPVLEQLLKPVAGIDRLITGDAQLPACDAYVPLLSLPGILGTVPATVSAPIPYLQVDPRLVTEWQQKLAVRSRGFQPPSETVHHLCRIGIAWQGNPKYRHDATRSIPLNQFGRLARCDGVQLVSLQKGRGSEQIRGLTGAFEVVDLESQLGTELESFMNLAAVIKNLDLVIACDTAVAHLAGALGMKVWLCLPFDPDWRWLLQREDTPWYPKMRVFRQTAPGEWEGVFERMAKEIRVG
jgi:tetratricopeptide (TPR) repeat protein